MLITQTPLRISFFGGGTDFAGFYHEEEGCVLSAAIDKYIYVLVKTRFDHLVRVGYTTTEMVESAAEVKHELVREALQMVGIHNQIEINTMGDIPSTGSGLGSSGTVTVGVLNALHHYTNNPQPLDLLAHQACEIEIGRLGKPIGKQDQYIAAYGGLRFIRFLPNEQVVVESLNMSPEEQHMFSSYLMLFYTNTTRKAEDVLTEQRANIAGRRAVLREMKSLAFEGRKMLEAGNYYDFGHLLNDGWQLKKKMASRVTNPTLDAIYQKACQAGALGGKITGAGGGGFLLLFCPHPLQRQVRQALAPLPVLPVSLEMDGSKVIFNYRR
ncbi:MAG: GHMP kinase [Anaerolineales bacterium]|nr:GHMP kinase [Anaerolineales bacterium]